MKRVADAASTSDAKRPCPEAPSKVLFFRRLSPATTEDDLRAFCSAFGGVVQVLRLKEKAQGFVQMATAEAAALLVSSVSAQPMAIRGQAVDVHFSPREEVTGTTAAAPAFSDPQMLGMSMFGSPAPKDATNGRVVHITFVGMTYPVTCELLYSVFSQCGPVLKIVGFEKNGQRQALVEFADSNSASVARTVFNGHSPYGDGAILKVDSSKLPQVNVRSDDPNGRDYTAAAFPMPPTRLPPVPRGPGMMAPPGMAPTAPSAAPIIVPAGMGGGGPSGVGQTASSKVLLANNLNKERVTPTVLFKLFGTCGDVMRVKILYHKRDMAFIQLRDESHAYQALIHLKDCMLFDQKMNIQCSKMKEVPLPPPSAAEAYDGLTQDYSASRLHRFANPNSKNASHITAPGPALHLSNIPDGVDEPQVVQLFALFGVVVSFKFFVSNRKMAIVRLDSVSNAINALVALHGEDLTPYGLPPGDGRGLVVSFAKSAPAT